MGVPEELVATPRRRAFIELHCHTSASFDSLANPLAVAQAAASRGLTHLAITDHDRIGRRPSPSRRRPARADDHHRRRGQDGRRRPDRRLPARSRPTGHVGGRDHRGRSEQGGLVGVPHPFDRMRGFGRKSGTSLESVAHLVDWVEAYNARVIGGSANEKAAKFAASRGCPESAPPIRTPSWRSASPTTS